MTGFRQDAAVQAASAILDDLARRPGEATPERLARIAAIVLEAICQCEWQLAGRPPTYVLCLRCYRPHRVLPETGCVFAPCPACGHPMRMPESTYRN